jgi:probable H4MPT-linked C1 transfer pathway protein
MIEPVYCGWDIGGAHLKVAYINAEGDIMAAQQLPSPLWKGLDTLVNALKLVSDQLPQVEIFHSVTTTAELADIFTNRHQGVLQIKQELSHVLGGDQFCFYAGSAGIVPANKIEKYTNQIASSNWHATANYVSRLIKCGILVDIGSTTTDIIPFANGKVLNQGSTDFERMQTYELVYTGIVRTPVMAVVDCVPHLGQWVSIAAEHFATMADIFRLTGELNEYDDMMETADGAGKELIDSARRLARMLGTDISQINNLPHWKKTAKYIAEQQLLKIQQAFFQILFRGSNDEETVIVGAGAGRFIVEKLARRNGLRYIDITKLLNASIKVREEAARCAAAISVAQIMRCTA